MRFTSGDDDVDVEAGTVVVVPIGVPHPFSNPFQDQAVFIGTMPPDLYIQYFRDLGQPPVDHQGMLNPADIARIRAEDPECAREIQRANGEKFQEAFARGLAVTGFERSDSNGTYLLEPYE